MLKDTTEGAQQNPQRGQLCKRNDPDSPTNEWCWGKLATKPKAQERKPSDVKRLSAKHTVGTLFESQFKDSKCAHIEGKGWGGQGQGMEH